MTIETKPWDAAELLDTPADIAAYLDAYLEDGTTEELLGALNTIARSRGMTALARDTGISREALYRAFSDNGNPQASLETLRIQAGRWPDRAALARVTPGNSAS